MTIRARPYQTEAVSSLYAYFASKPGNPVIAMPTATGKSVVIALFLESVFKYYPNQRVMILTHVKELIEQNYEKLMRLWPFAPSGVYSAGLNRRDVHAAITFAGIASVAKKWALFGHIDLVIIDEAHLVSPTETTMYQKFLGGLRTVNPHVKVIGLTATPWRLGHGHITDPAKNEKGEETPSIFTDVCFDITGVESFNRLIAEGYLCPVVPKGTSTKLDVGGVHMRAGEYIPSELQAAVDKQEVTVAAIREAMELGHNRKHWLVFASGVEHAIHTAGLMNDMGVPTVAIHSKLTTQERDDGIAKFKSGHYRAAVNNNVLTTGFDFPGIDLIVGLRPTASTVLWVQMLGRGTRPVYAPGYDLADFGQRMEAIRQGGKPNCLVLDFANNTRRLGPINDPVIPRRKGEGTGEAPVKECPVCHTWVHASVRRCTGVMLDDTPCQHEFKFETKLKQGASTAELIKGDMPMVEVFKVDHITYAEHRKEGRPPMMKVGYYCGLRMFEEFVCIEHPNFASKKARDWWRLRSTEPPPSRTAEVLDKADRLRTPTHLRVWINKKYPEILAVCFDGTAFGKESASSDAPTVETRAPGIRPFSGREHVEQTVNDDIPF